MIINLFKTYGDFLCGSQLNFIIHQYESTQLGISAGINFHLSLTNPLIIGFIQFDLGFSLPENQATDMDTEPKIARDQVLARGSEQLCLADISDKSLTEGLYNISTVKSATQRVGVLGLLLGVARFLNVSFS